MVKMTQSMPLFLIIPYLPLQVLYYVISSESSYRKTISDKKEINVFADLTQNSETEKVPREIINIECFVKTLAKTL